MTPCQSRPLECYCGRLTEDSRVSNLDDCHTDTTNINNVTHTCLTWSEKNLQNWLNYLYCRILYSIYHTRLQFVEQRWANNTQPANMLTHLYLFIRCQTFSNEDCLLYKYRQSNVRNETTMTFQVQSSQVAFIKHVSLNTTPLKCMPLTLQQSRICTQYTYNLDLWALTLKT